MGDDQMTLRFLAAPTDAGYSSGVTGGRVAQWMDHAGYACAVGWSGTYCVTAYVGNVEFSRPISVGHLVEVTARLVHTGRSSMHILVTLRSGPIKEAQLAPATQCLMVFVATGQGGKPTEVRKLVPTNEQGRDLQANAVRRIQLRGEIEAAMERQTFSGAGTAPSQVLRFLAPPADVNWGGKVHGGSVMRWIDDAAHVLATAWTGSAANVAVYAGGVRFYRPLLIGHLVEVEARLLLTTTKSMHISVHVRAGDPATGVMELTTHCLIIFVSLGEEGRAVPSRHWAPVSDEDEALQRHALDLVNIRAKMDD